MNRSTFIALFILFFISITLFSCKKDVQHTKKVKTSDYPIQAVPFHKVKVNGGFWLPFLERNHHLTIRHNWHQCKKTGRINNFYVAAGIKRGQYSGHHTSADSDVFKTIDGMARSLALFPDSALEKRIDEFAEIIDKAQEKDGYLFTPRTISPKNPPEQAGPKRWAYLTDSHELYNVGHLYEAAISYFEASGKTNLLDIALKNADYLCETFGQGKRNDIPGHQEIEIGLVKLYRYTGQEKYLNLAKFFLEQRGNHNEGRSLYTYTNDPAQVQDHLPVVKQTEARGHAVRLGYQAVAMADLAVLTDDTAYMNTLLQLWDDVVTRKMYLTGGMGSKKEGESFGAPYYLPNKEAYAETCAGISNMLWQYRMFRAHGDAKYLDVMERVIYNGILASPNLSSNTFFYVNPLASDGNYKRKPWYGVPCCPTNIGRTIPSLQGYAFARKGDNIYVNFFMDCETKVDLPSKNKVELQQKTDYPYNGNIFFTINPDFEEEFELRLRIPGWVKGQPVPGDLYYYLSDEPANCFILINKQIAEIQIEKGFANIRRMWKKGDVVELKLPMNIRRVLSNSKIEDNEGKVALERGPLVFCAEDVDNKSGGSNPSISDFEKLHYNFDNELMDGTPTIKGKNITAIPYYKWANRGNTGMAVWVKRH